MSLGAADCFRPPGEGAGEGEGEGEGARAQEWGDAFLKYLAECSDDGVGDLTRIEPVYQGELIVFFGLEARLRNQVDEFFADPALVFDAAAYATCLAALAACADDALPCNGVFIGTRALAEGCARSFQCQPGLQCTAEFADQCGTCVAPPLRGERQRVRSVPLAFRPQPRLPTGLDLQRC